MRLQTRHGLLLRIGLELNGGCVALFYIHFLFFRWQLHSVLFTANEEFARVF